jgi:hypothetical protein
VRQIEWHPGSPRSRLARSFLLILTGLGCPRTPGLGATPPLSHPGRYAAQMADAATWSESSEFLRSTGVEAAQHTADLLDTAASRWSERLVSRTSMHDLLFTLPGDDYPFSSSLRVSWTADTFEFTLHRGDQLVSADRCHEDKALDVLVAFLEQLTSEG